jgi:hypothetical protein
MKSQDIRLALSTMAANNSLHKLGKAIGRRVDRHLDPVDGRSSFLQRKSGATFGCPVSTFDRRG